jgi:cell division protein FtsI (penicillin-binding protein 3)
VKQIASFIAWRFYLILVVIALVIIGLIYRVFNLAILDQYFLRHQGDERVLRQVSIPAFRGMIVDRNEFPLAVSTSVFSVWFSPREFYPTIKTLSSIAKLLNIETEEISALISHYRKKKKEFAYLKRNVMPEIAYQIKSLRVPGLYLQQEYHRYYPEGEVAAHLVGFTDIDDHGQEGLELAYNKWLQGEPGKKWVIKDRLGRVIADIKTVQEQQPGHDLILSIDRRVQYLAYRELLAGIIQNRAHSGSAVVLDVKTGEVLAMVNQPSFNPNNHTVANSSNFRNRAVTDLFEPGSTIKAFSIASALDSGHYKPDNVVDTHPGWLRIGRNLVKDEKNHGLLSVRQIMQISSNVGVTKMILGLPPNQLWSLLHRVGFGEVTGVGFPGEQSGSLTKHSPWGQFVLATLGFGYGLSVTALQLARAYDVLANNGVKVPISLLRLNEPPSGEQVMSPGVTQEMLNLLESVVSKEGTGTSAQIPGYRVAGKTGTAIMAGIGGYQKHRYVSSFVGVAPASQPRLVVAVVIHDPQGKSYFGGRVSAPVFERIMEGTLRILNIAPDGV